MVRTSSGSRQRVAPGEHLLVAVGLQRIERVLEGARAAAELCVGGAVALAVRRERRLRGRRRGDRRGDRWRCGDGARHHGLGRAEKRGDRAIAGGVGARDRHGDAVLDPADHLGAARPAARHGVAGNHLRRDGGGGFRRFGECVVEPRGRRGGRRLARRPAGVRRRQRHLGQHHARRHGRGAQRCGLPRSGADSTRGHRCDDGEFCGCTHEKLRTQTLYGGTVGHLACQFGNQIVSVEESLHP